MGWGDRLCAELTFDPVAVSLMGRVRERGLAPSRLLRPTGTACTEPAWASHGCFFQFRLSSAAPGVTCACFTEEGTEVPCGPQRLPRVGSLSKLSPSLPFLV